MNAKRLSTIPFSLLMTLFVGSLSFGQDIRDGREALDVQIVECFEGDDTSLIDQLKSPLSVEREKALEAIRNRGKMSYLEAETIVQLILDQTIEDLSVVPISSALLGYLGSGFRFEAEEDETQNIARSALRFFEAHSVDIFSKLKETFLISNQTIREGALFSISQLASSGDDRVVFLIEALSDTNATIQIASARALGLMGGQAKRAIPSLKELLLSDRSATVRESAAQALVKVGEGDDEAISSLLAALNDNDPFLRRTAAFALGKLKSPTLEVLMKLLDVLSDNHQWARHNAAQSIISLASQSPNFIAKIKPQLLEMVANSDSGNKARIPGAWVLGHLGRVDKKIEEDLLKQLSSPHGNTRQAAASALGHMGEHAKESVQQLIRVFRDPNPEVRKEAAIALGRIGVHAKEAVPKLMEGFDELDSVTKEAIIEAFGEIGENAVRALPLLMREASGKNQWTSLAAIRALEKIGEPAKDAIPILIEKILSSSERQVSWAAARALGEMGSHSRRFAPMFLPLIEEFDSNRSYLVASAIGQLGEHARGIVPDLVYLLSSSDDPAVRAVAANALGNLGSFGKEAVYPLIAALSDQNYRVRVESVRALGEMGSAALKAKPYLEKALLDSNSQVAGQAKYSLTRIQQNR